jgi:hypothetical protein
LCAGDHNVEGSSLPAVAGPTGHRPTTSGTADGPTVRPQSVPQGQKRRGNRKPPFVRHPDRGANKNAKRWLACWEKPDGAEGIAANLNPKVTQARPGHASITETTGTYGHLFPDAEDHGRGVIDAVLAKNPAELDGTSRQADREGAGQGLEWG